MPSDTTIDELVVFLQTDTTGALSWVMNGEGQHLIDEELLALIQRAWREVLEVSLGPSVLWLQQARGNAQRRQALDQAGFTDIQWAPKRTLMQRALAAFVGLLAHLKGLRLHPKAIARLVASPFAKVLLVIDKILGSLVKAISQLEPLREMKEVVETAIG